MKCNHLFSVIEMINITDRTKPDHFFKLNLSIEEEILKKQNIYFKFKKLNKN